MEGPDVKETRLTSNLGKYFKKAIPANQVKGLCEIYEGHKEWLLLFLAFLLQLSEVEYHVSGGSITVDPRLTDGSTYRLFELQTSLAAKFRFDLQPENRLTDQKNPKME